MNRFETGRCHRAPLVKCRITCLRVTLRELENFLETLLMTLVDGQHIRLSFL